ncbi:MAG: site-2 protease family protein [Arenicella sp.]
MAFIASTLREDIDLYQGTRSHEGLPTYVLHDRWKNRFFNIGWLEYEILKRWYLRDSEEIAQSVCEETTLYAEPQDVEALQTYLKNQEVLTEQATPEGVSNLIESSKNLEEKKRKSRIKLNPMAYFSFRIPLIRPDSFLESTVWLVRPLMTKKAFYVYLVLFFIAMTSVLQQWHTFQGYIKQALSWEGAAYLFLALAVSKSVHEFGHAYTVKSFGLKVPTMGVMWMMIFGFLYTDTTESWKLKSRKQRVAIGSAGVLAELQLAVIATLLWSVLPDGGLRYACFYLGTAAWIATLLINLSPFLRWDGYWVLSDLVGIQNLRERSGKLAEWFFGKIIMGFQDDIPVKLPRKQVRFSIIFAILSWFYRIGIFLGIGLLIFSRVFKLLGIFLLVMMLGKMVFGTIIDASISWFKRRKEMQWNKYSISSFSFIFFVILLLVIPWRSSIQAPAVVAPEQHIELYPGVSGKVAFVPEKGVKLTQGDSLFRMENPELTSSLDAERNNVEYYQLALKRTGSKLLLESRALERQRLQEANGRYIRVLREMQKLNATAPYDGKVIWVSDIAKQGGWIDANSPILTFADTKNLQMYAYIGEYDLQRLYTEGDVIFYPENSFFKPIKGKIVGVDSANISTLDYEILSSTKGGPIAAVKDSETGKLKPSDALYLIRIALDNKTIKDLPILLRGRVMLRGERKSFASRFFDSLIGTIIRESGF